MPLFVTAFFPKPSTIRQKMLPPFYFENLLVNLTISFKRVGSKKERAWIKDSNRQEKANNDYGQIDDHPDCKAQEKSPSGGQIKDPHASSSPAITRPFQVTGKPKTFVISETMKINRKPATKTGNKIMGSTWKRPILFAKVPRTKTQSR